MAIPAETRFSGQISLSDAKRAENDGSCWPEEAFRSIFLEIYARLSGVVFRIVGDYSQAEDLAIEAFWRLYRQSYGSGKKFNPCGWRRPS